MKGPVPAIGVNGQHKSGMAHFHPIPRLAAAILSGSYRQYIGHPAAPDWPAEVDPKQPFVEAEHSDARPRKRAYGARLY